MKRKNKIIINERAKNERAIDGKVKINAQNINSQYDFDNLDDCRHFLNNLFIDGARVKAITLANGFTCPVEEIPENQIIQRAKEIRSAIFGKPEIA